MLVIPWHGEFGRPFKQDHYLLSCSIDRTRLLRRAAWAPLPSHLCVWNNTAAFHAAVGCSKVLSSKQVYSVSGDRAAQQSTEKSRTMTDTRWCEGVRKGRHVVSSTQTSLFLFSFCRFSCSMILKALGLYSELCYTFSSVQFRKPLTLHQSVMVLVDVSHHHLLKQKENEDWWEIDCKPVSWRTM